MAINTNITQITTIKLYVTEFCAISQFNGVCNTN